MNVSSSESTSRIRRTIRKKGELFRYLPFDDPARVFCASPLEKISAVRAGLHPLVVTHLATEFNITTSTLCTCIGLSYASLLRKERSHKPLPPEYSERVLGILSLVGKIQIMVDESGNPEEFDAMAWFAAWAFSFVPALGGNTPASYFDTMAGQQMVASLLASMQSGAYQ
jgi:uncharacterized protein (DUF2384 family)